MKVQVIRRLAPGKSELLTTLEMELNQLPRKDDYLMIDDGDDTYGVIVHHVFWKWVEGRLDHVEISST